MKTNKGVLLLIFLIILNLLFGSTLIYVIAIIETPNVVASIEMIELNENEALIEIKIDIYNPNLFSIIIKNFEIRSINLEGLEFGNIQVIGGEVAGSSNSTFINKSIFSFKNYDLEPIIHKITGEIGFKIFGIIDKFLPINLTIITQFKDILTKINPPDVTINGKISDVTEEGISFLGEVIIFNPNTFKILIEDIELTVESDLNDVVGSFEITSGEIDPNSYKNFTIEGDLSYKTLDANYVNITLNAKAGAQIAGFEKIINISSTTIFDIPDFQELLLINGTMEFSISGEFKLKIDGILANVGLIVYNPSEVPLYATNIVCIVSSMINNETKELVKNNLKSSSIPSKEEAMLTTEIKIPYFELLIFANGKIFPDLLVITIQGDFSIEGTNQYMPLSFNGYIDLNLLN